jgi:hypothetical protein
VLVSGTGRSSTVLDATSPKATATGSAGARRGSGRAWTTETHLDLTDPGHLAAARAFLAQVSSPEPRLGDVVRVSDELRRRLDAFGVVHARTLEVEQDGIALGGSVALGVQVGVEVERSVQNARVVEAATRGIDGVWREREDCLSPR